MNNLARRGIILGLVMISIGTVYLVNKPKKISIDDLYQTNEVGTLMTNEFGDTDSGVIGFEKIKQNDFLALYLDEDTSHFAVKDMRNDYTWYSSTKKSDPLIKTNTIKNLQRSTFQISYLQKDGTVATMNNYEYAISYKRDFDDSFQIETTDKGIKITYVLSDRDPKGYWFPAYISADRFNELVKVPVQLEGSQMDLRNLLDYYAPMEEDPNTYEIRQIIKDEETNEYDMTQLSGAQVETLFKLFYEIGYYGNKVDEDGNYIEEYHLEDIEIDNQAYGINTNFNLPEFVIPMEVNLNEDNLEVKVNYYEIEERNGFELVSIKLLPYFGAVRNDTEGYMIIPEGSGGLINFNNGKTASKSYSSFIYEADNLEIPRELTAKDVGAKLPIFGLKTPTSSMLGVIVDGISHSKVTADVSEKYDSYNKIYNEFIFRQAGSYRLAENTIQLWSESDYTYSPKIRYYFFDEEEANYSSMATLYGSYLREKYGLDLITDKKYSLYLDILGTYDFDSFFLWFPVNKNEALTTYEEAETMIKELQQLGVSDQVIRYIGWFNNGIEHSLPNQIDLDKALGSKRDLQAFQSFLSEQGFPVFYDVDFVKVYDAPLLYSTRNYSRVIGGSVSKFYDYSLSSGLVDKTSDFYYYSNLAAIDQTTSQFIKDAQKLNLSGISLRNMGGTLYSDFKNNNLTPREFTAYYYLDILAKFAPFNLMVENPNEYALSAADYITDLEANTSLLVVVDQVIPFYQIAIAPYINYSLPAYNYQDLFEQSDYLLKAIETGSSMKAMLSYTDTSVLINTDFKEYYSVYYQYAKDDIAALMSAYNSLGLDGSILIEHEIISSGLVLCRYSNEKVFVINYNDNDVTYLDQTISAKSYFEIEVD